MRSNGLHVLLLNAEAFVYCLFVIVYGGFFLNLLKWFDTVIYACDICAVVLQLKGLIWLLFMVGIYVFRCVIEFCGGFFTDTCITLLVSCLR